MDFIAIDLETATRERFSICEVGIAVVKNMKIVETRSWLIQPPYNQYEGFNIYIHGIHPSDTENCGTFPEVWDEIASYLNNAIIVAHNASFDMYALKEAFHTFHIEPPQVDYYCSYRLAKKIFKDCNSYSLPQLCHSLNIEFGKHHRAEGDAIGCAKIFMKCLEQADVNSYIELQEKYNFNCGSFSPDGFSPIHTIKGNKWK